jgi:hypothetical protein
MKRVMNFAVLAMMLVWAAGIGAGQAPAGDALNADALKGLAWRGIGPALATGRIQDIRYHAQLGRQSGSEVTPLGQAQSLLVVPLER